VEGACKVCILFDVDGPITASLDVETTHYVQQGTRQAPDIMGRVKLFHNIKLEWQIQRFELKKEKKIMFNIHILVTIDMSA
jgi:hypothetical protein